MFPSEDDVYEIMLLSMRLATQLGLPAERRLFRRILEASDIAPATIVAWAKPTTAKPQDVKALLLALKEYQATILMLPDLFATGIVSKNFLKILDRAQALVPEVVIRVQPANEDQSPTRQKGEMMPGNLPFSNCK